MTQSTAFPIVGIGASAGGIPALKELFAKLPSDTGAAFVVIQHLDPGSKSLTAETLARETEMSVVQVSEGMQMVPDHVYAIPPNTYMTAHDHRLSLGAPEPRHGLRMPIDAFLWSLAKQHEEQAIAIILSGTGHDGAGGVQAIAGHGGMVMAQSPAGAEYAGMPKSAIATGLVDIVCDVAEMPERLAQYIRNPFIARPEALEEEPQARDYESCMRSIVALLRTRTGYDFQGYKQGTMRRRISRRMGLLNITSIKAYLEYLREHQQEAVAFHQDLLIRVTTFFRDEEAFRALDSKVITPLVERKSRVQLRLQQAVQRELLQEYAPAAILVDSHYRVVYFFGQTAPYLEQPAGAPTQDLVNLARPELRSQLRKVLKEASSQERAASSPPLGLSRGNTRKTIKIVARPYVDSHLPESLLLVAFEEQPGQPGATTNAEAPSAGADDSIIQQLEADLAAARAELHQSIEEQETVNEEMQAANEEVISINEELQSSNEELESSKEELQSLNEELSTLNSQLNLKIEELARSNEDMDNLLSSTDIATLFLDTEMRIGRFTPATNRLFNLISTDVGRPFGDIRQKFQGGDLLADARRVLQSLTPLEQEVMTEEGNWYLRRILPYRTRDHRIDGVVITFIDITTRKRSEQQAQLFATVVRDSNDAITVQSLDGKITAWNRGAEQMYGFSESQALEMDSRDLIPEAERDANRHMMRRIVAGEGVHTMETTRLTRDGRGLDISLTITPLTDETGQVVAIATTERNITNRKRNEDALRLAKQQAESAAAAKTRFLATASHDLRQRLQSISLITSTLQKKVTDPELCHLLDKQNASLDDMGWLLDSLLDTVRLDSGGVEPTIEDVPVRPLLARLHEEFSSQAAEKGLELSVTVNHELCVRSDSGLLTQLLANLLGNAIRYTEQGQISLDCDRENSHVRISVTDTGIGIPEAARDLIFDEFHQVNPNPQDKRRGMGLGLAIVQRIARLLGTRIELESEVGHGSCFSLTLPVAESAVAEAPDERPSPAATARAGRKILLLDDDPAVLDSLQTLLKLEGFAVAAGASPQDAHAALENFTPDIIVSDFHLGNPEPAVEVVRKIRADTGQPVPAIIITGDTSVSLQGLDNAQLKIKPLKSEELLELIDELLAANRA